MGSAARPCIADIEPGLLGPPSEMRGRDRRWPTATPTATRAHRGGLRRAATPGASWSKTPADGSELGKQSLRTGGPGPRGPATAFAVPPVPADGSGHSLPRAASGGLPTSQVVVEDGPRPSRELVPDADTSESGSSAGGCWQRSARVGSPRSPQHRSPPADRRAGCWCWLLGLQQPHVAGLGALRPRRHVELDGLALIK